jgi:hypothetical protein
LNKEIEMKANVGNVDRVLRTLVGIGLLALVFAVEGPARWWGLAGIVPLATAWLRFCPAYALLGFDTCALRRRNA